MSARISLFPSATPLDRRGKAIQSQAAKWLAQRERGLTLAEQADFADWLAMNPRHGMIFAEVEAAWWAMDALAGYPHSIDISPEPDLLVRPGSGTSRRVFTFSAILAAAAAVVIGALLSPESPRVDPAAATIARVDPRFLRMPDGSMVELNDGSSVTQHFTPTLRLVRLTRGEAHFTVATDSRREFIVEVGSVAVRALGTAFNVRLEGASVEVLVTEGHVRVTPAANEAATATDTTTPLRETPIAPVLTAGQRTIVAISTVPEPSVAVVETLASAEIDRRLAWQTSRFAFDATPLSEVVARFNAHAARPNGTLHLTVEDAELGALRISGRVRGDNISSFVDALESSFGVRAERRENGEIVLRRADRR